MGTQEEPKKLSFAECDKIICTPGSPFELEQVVIAGRPTTVWKHCPTSFRKHLMGKMDEFSDRVLLNAPVVEPGDASQREVFTFGEIRRRALDVAAWLVARGVRCHDPVGVVGFNSAGWIVAWTAVHLIGAVPVMANAAIQPDSLVHCLRTARPRIVLCDAGSAATLSYHKEELAKAGVAEIFSWQNADHLKHKGVEVLDFASLVQPFKATKAIVDGVGFGIENQTPESDGVIFFTSGTTGYPKAVVSSQRAALHNVISSIQPIFRAGLRAGATLEMLQEMAAIPPPQQPTALMAVPFFHVTGCLSILLKTFSDGGQMVTMRRWNVDEAVRLMTDLKVNVVGGVPAILIAIMQHPGLPKEVVLTGASYGGAPPPGRMPSDVKKRWPEIGLVTAWGMTETNAPHTVNVGDDYVAKPKSCGVALPVAEVRIACPDTKRILGTGQTGMIQTRGMTMMKGYLNDKAANEKSYDKDGWFDTGDAGYIDEEGFLFIADRIKDIIIRGGENISSEEVENAIYLDDRVAEAAAVPVPDDMLGELVAVAVSLRPGAKATAEQIIAAAHGRLRSHARPAFVWVSPELLPRNANGKVIKTELKVTVGEMYAKSKQRAKL